MDFHTLIQAKESVELLSQILVFWGNIKRRREQKRRRRRRSVDIALPLQFNNAMLFLSLIVDEKIIYSPKQQQQQQ